MLAKPLFRRIILVVWVVSIAVIVRLSLMPQVTFPLDFWNADKLYHLGAYAWLGALPLFAFARLSQARQAAYAMIMLGALLEWGQSFVPGRDASVMDAMANTVGVFGGIWLAGMLRERWLPAGQPAS